MSRAGYSVAKKRARYEMFALETENLRLSVLRKSEAPRISEYLLNNMEFHRKFSQTHTDDYFTVSTQIKYLA